MQTIAGSPENKKSHFAAFFLAQTLANSKKMRTFAVPFENGAHSSVG